MLSSDAECLAQRARDEAIEREQQKERAEAMRVEKANWDARYGTLNQACEQRQAERTTFGTCQKQYGATCNPNGFVSQNACVEQRMSTSAPSEQDAHSQLKQEWNSKAPSGNNASASKKSQGRSPRVPNHSHSPNDCKFSCAPYNARLKNGLTPLVLFN